tara:strand:- start:485 stop:715 length:231 start_codon:yes stop_codon:yes gene_type:complete
MPAKTAAQVSPIRNLVENTGSAPEIVTWLGKGKSEFLTDKTSLKAFDILDLLAKGCAHAITTADADQQACVSRKSN